MFKIKSKPTVADRVVEDYPHVFHGRGLELAPKSERKVLLSTARVHMAEAFIIGACVGFGFGLLLLGRII